MPWSVTYGVAVDLDRDDLALEAALLGRLVRRSWCERTASSSSSERGISHWSAIISAPRPWPTMLCFSISFGVKAAPYSCWVFMPAANGMWPMCSTPAPMTTSWTPEAICAAAEVDGLLGRAALAVDRRRRRLDRQALLQPGVAGDVEGLLAELLHAAGDDVLDLGRVDARRAR